MLALCWEYDAKATAPFIEPTHGVPFDYFRYTISGAMKLFEDVGLTTWLTEKSGDGLLTAGRPTA